MAWSPQARAAAARSRKLKARPNSRSVVAMNRRAKNKVPYRSGTLVVPHVNHGTGKVSNKSYAVYDSKHNRRKRVQYTAVGAAVGTAIAPGLGTYIGGVYGANRGARKYGATIKPIKAGGGKGRTSAKSTTRKVMSHKGVKVVAGAAISNPNVAKKKKKR